MDVFLEVSSIPLMLIGAMGGVFSFAPLAYLVVPVIKKIKNANMTKAYVAVALSVFLLIGSFFVVYLLVGNEAISYAIGLVGGFCLVWVGIACIALKHMD